VERSVGRAQAVPPGVARHDKLAVTARAMVREPASRNKAGTSRDDHRAVPPVLIWRTRACPAPSILEPLWVQFAALLPTRQVHHPLGCHRPRVPDRVVFDKLIQILVFGCGYRRIADPTCSATTLRRRRDEWITLGLAERLSYHTAQAASKAPIMSSEEASLFSVP
jgi:transposase